MMFSKQKTIQYTLSVWCYSAFVEEFHVTNLKNFLKDSETIIERCFVPERHSVGRRGTEVPVTTLFILLVGFFVVMGS